MKFMNLDFVSIDDVNDVIQERDDEIQRLSKKLEDKNLLVSILLMKEELLRRQYTIMMNALEIYQNPANWSIRSLLPEDIRDTDEWIGPEIPGWYIAKKAIMNVEGVVDAFPV